MTGAEARGPGDRGSVVLLGIGLLGCCLLTLAVVVDAGAALQQRQALLAIADGASLAGAQALDLDAYYESGAMRGTVLQPAGVRAAALDYVRVHAPGVRVDSVATDGQVATVVVSGPLRLPFLQGVLGSRIRVRSAARLDAAAQ